MISSQISGTHISKSRYDSVADSVNAEVTATTLNLQGPFDGHLSFHNFKRQVGPCLALWLSVAIVLVQYIKACFLVGAPICNSPSALPYMSVENTSAQQSEKNGSSDVNLANPGGDQSSQRRTPLPSLPVSFDNRILCCACT
jgi:hypothetical protein